MWKKVLALAVLTMVTILCGIRAYHLIFAPESVQTKETTKQTDSAVADIVDENTKLRREAEELTKKTEIKVVNIRAATRKEIDALSPDSVADAIRMELEMFRGRDAGDKAPAYPGGVDGE